MGLTKISSSYILNDMLLVTSDSPDDIVVSLAGNPNTGKSTVFNNLTGLNQHTGNWPGKTVINAQGNFLYNNTRNIIIDLPGTYSLLANSVEEEVARDFICFGNANVTVIVVDATCLERNLNLVLQILEMTSNVVVCLNLMDEANKKNILIDLDKLSTLLGVPVVGTSARNGDGLDKLKSIIQKVATGKINTNPTKISYDELIEKSISHIEPYIKNKIPNKDLNSRWLSIRLIDNDTSLTTSLKNYFNYNLSDDRELEEKIVEARRIITENESIEKVRDNIVTNIVEKAEEISKSVVTIENTSYNKLDRKADSILTSKLFGIPIMISLLGIIFWLTIQGANYPSQLIAKGLFFIEGKITYLFMKSNAPTWIHGILILGIYRTLAWVISVMLPPMAIFFPMFTLLEDLGYLPRVAFNLDNFFKKAHAHGKQALTMCMGFGCNAAGIIGCRIINSPRERIIAILTNNFVPCNGRFPTLIAISTIFIASYAVKFKSILATLAILIVIVLGVVITLIISRILSKTILKGLPSSFNLELPPYRKPLIGQVIVRSIFDRTLFVLGRAIIVAAPAGLIIWLMANITVGNSSVLTHCALFLDPFASLIGLDGYILMAFILGLPANEIVLPILIMSYMSKGAMLELDSLKDLHQLLIDNGWTFVTAICTMIFSLNHWPCGTTLLTIKKETGSLKWTGLSFLIPTVTGIVLCFIVAQGYNLFTMIF
jgi:ferrous iron transport protein B